MAAGRTTFEKLQRDRAKKAKADAKRAKRMGKDNESGPLVAAGPDDEGVPSTVLDGRIDEAISPEDLLLLVEEVQKQFDNDEISFDEYEERKIELMERLSVS